MTDLEQKDAEIAMLGQDNYDLRWACDDIERRKDAEIAATEQARLLFETELSEANAEIAQMAFTIGKQTEANLDLHRDNRKLQAVVDAAEPVLHTVGSDDITEDGSCVMVHLSWMEQLQSAYDALKEGE